MSNNYNTSTLYIGQLRQMLFIGRWGSKTPFTKPEYIAFEIKKYYSNYDIVVDIFTRKEYIYVSSKSYISGDKVDTELFNMVKKEKKDVEDAQPIKEFMTYSSDEISKGEILSILYNLNKKPKYKEEQTINDIVLGNIVRISRKIDLLQIDESIRQKLNEKLYDISSRYVQEYLTLLDESNDFDSIKNSIKEKYLKEIYIFEKQLDEQYKSENISEEFSQIVPILRR